MTTVIVKIMRTHKPVTFVEKVKVCDFHKNREIVKCAKYTCKTPNVTWSVHNGPILDNVLEILSFLQQFRQIYTFSMGRIHKSTSCQI